MKKLICSIFAGALLAGGATAGAATVTVFAAASLTDSLKEIAAVYEKESGDKLVFNFAASGLLARQIEEGAPADLFFCADEARADALEKKGLLGTRKSRLSNSLAVVAAADSALAIRSARDLTKVRRLALGQPKLVPAGAYSKAYLEKLKLWPAIESKVVPCENVRAVLAAVESGNVDAGIVYKTDAAISKKVKVVFEVPRAEGPSISYPMALVKGSPQPEAAKRFFDYLGSPEAAKVFGKYGFVVLDTSKGAS
jgi:molybdate transport system substrate-binding protein